jgi:hypothetical protein
MVKAWKNVKHGENFASTEYKFNVNSLADEIAVKKELREARAFCLSDAEFVANFFNAKPRKGFTRFEFKGAYN